MSFEENLAPDYLPIGQVRITDPYEGLRPAQLLLGLAGKDINKVLLFEHCCQAVAPNFTAFLARLFVKS